MEKEIIGSNTYVDVMGIKNIPAKIDTGADSSAIWASDVEVDENGTLKFKLFGKKSEFYTGETIETNDYKVVMNRSSHGEEKIFYRTHITIKLGTHKIKALMTLSSREKNNFPILIGKRTLKNKYIVDVSQNEISIEKKIKKTTSLVKELKQNPYKFHQKYFKKGRSNEMKVLWTGGLDSTYMIIKMARECKGTINPVYIVSDGRQSVQNELNSINKNLELIRKRDWCKAKINDIEIIQKTDLPEYEEGAKARKALNKKGEILGTQYIFIASYAKQFGFKVCVGLEKWDIGSSKINQYGKLIKEDNFYKIDQANSSPDINCLFGDVYLPIYDVTTRDIYDQLLAWDCQDIISNVWFCHSPINGEPCGICNPCVHKYTDGMTMFFSDDIQKRTRRWIKIRKITHFPAIERMLRNRYIKRQNKGAKK